MQRLLATAAAVSVGTGTVSCGKQPMTSTDSRGCGSGTSASNGDAGADANVAQVPPTGYAVVDPVPTPAYCPGIAPLVKATAKLVRQRSGELQVVVTLPTPTGRDDFKYVKDAPVTGYGTTAAKGEVRADGTMVVTATVLGAMADAGEASISVSVKGACNKGPLTLSASISWSGKTKTPSPTVYLSEY